MVINTSNASNINVNSSPFFLPDQPISGTVFTLCPISSFLSLRGRHSSIRIFMHSRDPSQLQELNYLLTANSREVIQEVIDSFATRQIVNQILNRNTCASE